MQIGVRQVGGVHPFGVHSRAVTKRAHFCKEQHTHWSCCGQVLFKVSLARVCSTVLIRKRRPIQNLKHNHNHLATFPGGLRSLLSDPSNAEYFRRMRVVVLAGPACGGTHRRWPSKSKWIEWKVEHSENKWTPHVAVQAHFVCKHRLHLKRHHSHCGALRPLCAQYLSSEHTVFRIM